MLTVSALDLFASALGVFILLAILLFPYYLKMPALEAEVAGAERRAADAAGAASEAEQRAAAALSRRDAAERRRDEATAEQNQAETERLAAAAEAEKAAAIPLPPAEPKRAPPSPRRGAVTIGDLDVVFVMDATGSMKDEIADIQRSLLSIIRVLGRLAPSLRMGFVAFRDRGDDFLTLAFPLARMDAGNLARLQTFVRGLSADGGGDRPEPVADALDVALAMAWRPGAKGRIVVISDAPAHAPTWGRVFQMASGFHLSAPAGGHNRRISSIFTGDFPEGRAFHERLAQAGGGDLVTHRGRIMESVLLSVLDGGRG
jgi:Mg-chelatase subunit ChlD